MQRVSPHSYIDLTAHSVEPELPCGHVGEGLSDEDASEAQHGNTAVVVLSPTGGGTEHTPHIHYT